MTDTLYKRYLALWDEYDPVEDCAKEEAEHIGRFFVAQRDYSERVYWVYTSDSLENIARDQESDDSDFEIEYIEDMDTGDTYSARIRVEIVPSGKRDLSSVPCVQVTGFGMAPTAIPFSEWVEDEIQSSDEAIELAERYLTEPAGTTWPFNDTDGVEFYREFVIVDEPAFRAGLETLRAKVGGP